MIAQIKVLCIVIFLSILMLSVSCKKQKAEWKGTINEKDGVGKFKKDEDENNIHH